MVCYPQHSYTTSLGLLLARVPVGMFFLLAGVHKLQVGLHAFVGSTIGAVPSYIPAAIGRAYLFALPFAEITVGVLLVLGIATRLIGLIASLMLISFMMAITGFDPMKTGGPFHYNAVFLGITLLLMFAGAGKFSGDAIVLKKPSPPAPPGQS
jgi:thiosulfate dehydrogenase (quinone) large subunit